MSTDDDPGRQSLLALFHEEAQTQGRVLSDGLLTLEQAPADTGALEACMRAAHSLKGAARIIGLQDGVDVAHRMEEWFVAAQRGELTLSAGHIDVLLRGTDLLQRLGQPNPAGPVTRADVDAFIASMPASAGASGRAAEDAALRTALARLGAESAALTAGTAGTPRAADVAGAPLVPVTADDHSIVPPGNARDPQRMLRVRADSLDRLLSLSGESLVESRWLKPFAESMLRVKRTHRETAHALDACYERLVERLDPDAHAALNAVRQMLGSLQQALGEHVDELDRFDRRSTGLAQQLYDEALQCRMRPFGDATHAYPRLVRDLARSLGKRVRFVVAGETTQVDRDILDLLDAPLGHLLRNAIDHGIEPPEQRAALGKPAEAAVTLEARHSAGKLLIIVADDGAGIDLEAVRAAVVRRGLADPETAGRLSDHELFEFLLLRASRCATG